jgi:hypothetical protein
MKKIISKIKKLRLIQRKKLKKCLLKFAIKRKMIKAQKKIIHRKQDKVKVKIYLINLYSIYVILESKRKIFSTMII